MRGGEEERRMAEDGIFSSVASCISAGRDELFPSNIYFDPIFIHLND